MGGSISATALRRRSSSARRALGSFTRLLESVVVSEREAARGMLGTLDPRSKLIGAGVLLVAISLLHDLRTIAACWAVCAAAAVALGTRARRLAGLLVVPLLFSIAVSLPAVLNVVTPGRPVALICNLPRTLGPVRLPEVLAVTDSGLVVAARLVVRVGACVTIVAAAVLTTRRHHIVQALGSLGFPKPFVSVLTMMERYLEVLVRAAQQIHLARISRTIATQGLRQEHSWVAAGMGSLYRRSREMTEDVYSAMIARGFTGGHVPARQAPMASRDWVCLVACAAFGAALIILERRF